MFCGSCLRDNSLASALLDQKHDVVLVPLYTPTRTDVTNVSGKRVFFGGISIYLAERYPLFRKLPRFLAKLWDSPAVIAAVSGKGVTVDPAQLGALTVSTLEGPEGPQRAEFEKLVEWLRTESAPDIITLPYTLLIALAKPLKEATGRPVVCSLQGEELFLEGLPEPYRSRALGLIRAMVKDVDGFIAVSEYCARHMSEYLQIPPKKIRVVPLGIRLEGHAPRAPRAGSSFSVGYLARIAPEKGLHLLAEAYRALRQKTQGQQASLQVAGYLAPEHKGYLAAIEQKMHAWGLSGEFRYHGEVTREQKLSFLQTIDVLSVPCTYDEPKGLFVLEAMASGVPVVQTRRGAFPEMVETTGGGLLVEPDSAQALAEAFEQLWENRQYAAQLAARGYAAVQENYSVETMAARTAEAYKYFASQSSTSFM